MNERTHVREHLWLKPWGSDDSNAVNSDSSDRENRILAMSKWQGSCGLPSSASTQGGCRESPDGERWQSDSQRPAGLSLGALQVCITLVFF